MENFCRPTFEISNNVKIRKIFTSFKFRVVIGCIVMHGKAQAKQRKIIKDDISFFF